MSVLDIMAGSNRVGLAKAIQEAVRNYTHGHPMPPDEIIATMAFCTGSAIGIQEGNHRPLVELAGKFLAQGEDIGAGRKHESTGLIDIRGMVPN